MMFIQLRQGTANLGAQLLRIERLGGIRPAIVVGNVGHWILLFGIVAVLGRDAWRVHRASRLRRFARLRPAAFGWSRWWGALLWGLLFLILLLFASWLLRACAPMDPSLNIATHETPAPPAPEPPPDPTPVLKASLDDAQTDEKKLKAELAALQDDVKHKVAMCKPIEPPKPPPPVVAKAPPPPPPPAPPPQQQAHAAPPPNRPPPGMLPCDWSGDSGGEGVTRNKHYLGDRPGFVAINYNLYVRPDDIKVMYRGQMLAGTHGPRQGRGGFGFNWNPVAGDYSVDVIVTGEMWGTRWTYAMSCPRH